MTTNATRPAAKPKMVAATIPTIPVTANAMMRIN